MRKNNLILFAFTFVITACTSMGQGAKQSSSIGNIKDLPLSAKAEQASTALGQPDEKGKEIEDGQNLIIWRYKIGNSDRAILAFDASTEELVSKILIPVSTEPEYSRAYLLQNVFPNSRFEELNYRVCDQHYLPSEAISVEAAKGIIVRYDRARGNTTSIGWMAPDRARKIADRIKSKCLRGRFN